MEFDSFIGGLGIGGVLAFVILRYYLPSYLAEKGKNLATREDIEEITRKIEEVKAELNARHTLRFAALDKRLQSHQEAFGHCRKLLAVVLSRDKLQVRLAEMRNWFDENGLYLEASATEAFWASYHAAIEYSLHSEGQVRDMKSMKEKWDIILAAPDIILAAVGLPSLKLVDNERPPMPQ